MEGVASTLISDVNQYISDSTSNARGIFSIGIGVLEVIKYMPARFLEDAIANQRLYASERAGFTWGDAIYVAPVDFPKTTMMYGEVGVVGHYPVNETTNFFDASNARGVSLYQQWIATQGKPYDELTTTIHADLANRELRNDFRNRFKIDCIYFRPDETCANYVDVAIDWWLALTHWDSSRLVGSGYSTAVKGLKWCIVRPDSFQPEGRGYKPALFTSVTASHAGFTVGHYSSLSSDIGSAYRKNQVLICDFN